MKHKDLDFPTPSNLGKKLKDLKNHNLLRKNLDYIKE